MLNRINLALLLLTAYLAANIGDAKVRNKTDHRREIESEDSMLEYSEKSEKQSESSSEATESTEESSTDEESDDGNNLRKRSCPPCLDDIKKPWRDPRIMWICGGYQRARRSFKSICMMRYRNCQDGTMFVKLHDHRCKNDTYHGDHFFYDYKG